MILDPPIENVRGWSPGDEIGIECHSFRLIQLRQRRSNVCHIFCKYDVNRDAIRSMSKCEHTTIFRVSARVFGIVYRGKDRSLDKENPAGEGRAVFTIPG